MDPELLAIVEELKHLIINLSTSVWVAAMKGTISNAVELIVWGVFVQIPAYLSWKFGRKVATSTDYCDDGFSNFLYLVASIIVCIGVGLIMMGIKRIVAPEWYTIRMLMDSVRGN